MRENNNQAAKALLAVLTLIGIAAVILVALPIVSSKTTLNEANFHLSGHIIEPLVFVLLFAVTALLAVKLNKGWAVFCGLPFLALALLPFLQPNTDLSEIGRLKTLQASQAEQIEGLFAAQSVGQAAFSAQIVSLNTTISRFNIKDLLVLDCGGRAGCSCPSGWSKIRNQGFTQYPGDLTRGTGGRNFLYLCKR